MLVELHVRDLGVIADLRLLLGPGMTALTGETGAGKTLVVEAIELLVGGRADRVLVRPGADEAFVEGRFVTAAGAERVLARAISASAGGARSRAYVDGRMAPVSALAELGAELVDLHGQHAHQSLLSAATQRAALDAFAAADLSRLDAARARVKEIDASLAALGGDERSRAREIDLLRFQLAEIGDAAVDDPAEEDALEAEEERLATAAAARDAAASAHDLLAGDGGAADRVGDALATLGTLPALRPLAERLRAVQAEVADAATELRAAAESIEDDPERLAWVRSRRNQLRELRRKYGESLADVLAFAGEARRRLDELESHGARVAQLEAERGEAVEAEARAAAAVAKVRRKAAPALAAAVEERLRELAMPRARVEVAVDGEPPANDVAILVSANPGEPALPLSKVASGGELARIMLAARLVLSGPVAPGRRSSPAGAGRASPAGGPPTLVFDEVDAGIGGAAAAAVGKALAAIAAEHQVLVVTHLPQVAAFADAQVAVEKHERDGRTVAAAATLDDDTRVVELSRMLSGQPESATARDHAEELLAAAAREKARA
jgi:DNA repair protein RecN (Recombination protein N)